MTKNRERLLIAITVMGVVFIASLLLHTFGIGAVTGAEGLERHPAVFGMAGAFVQALVAGLAIIWTGKFGREQLDRQWQNDRDQAKADFDQLRLRSRQLGALVAYRVHEAIKHLGETDAPDYARTGSLGVVMQMELKALDRIEYERFDLEEMAAYEHLVALTTSVAHVLSNLHALATLIDTKEATFDKRSEMIRAKLPTYRNSILELHGKMVETVLRLAPDQADAA